MKIKLSLIDENNIEFNSPKLIATNTTSLDNISYEDLEKVVLNNL